MAGYLRSGAARVESIDVVVDSTGVATVEFVAGFLGGAVEVVAAADVGTVTLADTILIAL